MAANKCENFVLIFFVCNLNRALQLLWCNSISTAFFNSVNLLLLVESLSGTGRLEGLDVAFDFGPLGLTLVVIIFVHLLMSLHCCSLFHFLVTPSGK